MLDNFFVYHRTGKCLFSASYNGRPLGFEFMQGLKAASSTLFSFTHRNKEAENARREAANTNSEPGQPGAAKSDAGHDENIVTELVLGDLYFQFYDMGTFLLIAQGARGVPPSSLRMAIDAVRDTIVFYIGKFDSVSQDTTIFESIADIVRDVLKRQNELALFVNGVPCIPLNSRATAVLDRLLSSLEENHNVYGSALVIGDAVMHRRSDVHQTKMLLQHIAARPMNNSVIRCIPVYVDGRAQNMVLLRINNMVLCVFTHIVSAFSELVPYIENFEVSLEDEVYHLPKDNMPILLRNYTGLDTLAFLYYDSQKGKVVAPAFRLENNQNETMAKAFHWFFATAQEVHGKNGVAQLTMAGGEHIFHHIERNGVFLSALYSTVVADNVATLTDEIFDNVRRSLNEL
ncbi:unnamed protein product (mitochondrion) [Plasmodiophora brassicae]|uniref:FUZ/MON1/HPS1 first Longin domain-containing protein n=1 Tax=Plasmodiophora brassicae TaxID=37360 RepID=A0A3P3Y1J7_PLABS|nr:unnamed protein product [Plasmodiophora brassicae]